MLLSAALAAVSLALVVWMTQRTKEGWSMEAADRGNYLTDEQANLIRTWCSTGKSLKMLKKEQKNISVNLENINMEHAKNACTEGKREFQANKGKQWQCTKTEQLSGEKCKIKTLGRVRPCQGQGAWADMCCMPDGDQCLSTKYGKQADAIAADKAQRCRMNEKLHNCIGGYREVCVQGSRNKWGWRCCPHKETVEGGDTSKCAQVGRDDNRVGSRGQGPRNNDRLGCSTDGQSRKAVEAGRIRWDEVRGKCVQKRGDGTFSFDRSECCDGVNPETGLCNDGSHKGKTAVDYGGACPS